MKLSVIIPTYDTAEMTLVCCASVVAALPADAEVIVVDDASSDDTARRIGESFPSIVVLRQAVNRGFSASVNVGVAASRGELVLLLNSDTRIAAGTLHAFVRAFDEDARLGVAGAQLIDSGGSLQWSAGPVPAMLWMVVAVSGIARVARPFRRSRRTSGGEVGWVSGAAMAFRRNVWESAGPLREDFRFYAQDLDFCVRARREGWSVRLLSDVRVEHRHGATIARGSDLPYKPELLWPDLLTWGRGEYGDAWARRARWAMIFAAFVRSTFQRQFRGGYEALRNSSP
ncbi:MAG: glycosyltransferase family 2 protein [Acidobacteriota bacterium]|nr:glycosyltransferase family 2 protein [Acidobacteriota bacterium]